MNGLIYLDHNATVSQAATYVGKAFLYLTGTFTMTSNGLKLCAVVTSGSCDVNKWEPNEQALIIVANGEYFGSSAETALMGSIAVALKGQVEYQGGFVARRSILTETNTIMQGPMVSVNGVVVAGQSNNLAFPPLEFLPGGGEFQDPPPAKLLAVRDYEG